VLVQNLTDWTEPLLSNCDPQTDTQSRHSSDKEDQTVCDYSLMTQPNRLAQEGEELVVYRFPIGSLGLASPADVKRRTTHPIGPKKSLWCKFKEFLNPPRTDPVPAVCIPPGARLRLEQIPPALQYEFHVGACEEVRFTQLSAQANTYRDAVKFSNGIEVRLQNLIPGQRVVVLDMGGAGEDFLEHLRIERAEPQFLAELHRG
jgi:hypothetical protein